MFYIINFLKSQNHTFPCNIFLIIAFCLINTSGLRSQSDTILVDFGSTGNLSPMPWNNITQVVTGQIPDLVNSYGFLTGKGIKVVDRFNSVNSYGTSNPDPSTGYPASATIDCFFANTLLFNGYTLPVAGLELYNLDTATLYTVELFASRVHTNNLQTMYVLTGSAKDTLYLNAASNNGTVVSTSLYPDSLGTLKINASAGPDNNNSYGFYYLNALKLIYPHIPSNDPQSLNLVYPAGGEYLQSGKVAEILWNSVQINDIVVEYSTDMGISWIPVDSLKHYQQPYPWVVPATPSKHCLVRISSDTLSSVNTTPFEISNDTVTCTIVVLGSSTAAGSGASPADSAWVNRYRKALYQKNTRFEVINMAKGGYTTYHILPTGTPLPPHVTFSIDTVRNITEALSLNPYGIIINMPSNDASYNFTAQQQINNLRVVSNAASGSGVRIWVCTPQPRNFSNPAQIQIQRDMYDSVMTVYGTMAIDFWTGIANTNGYINPEYDSGDGIHLNNKGHGELFRRVWETNTDTPGCAPFIFIPFTKPQLTKGLSVYPNPYGEYINLQLAPHLRGTINLTLIDMNGRVLARKVIMSDYDGPQQVTWYHGMPSSPQPRLTGLIVTLTDVDGNTNHREMIKLVQWGR